jgi:hypothetical protein
MVSGHRPPFPAPALGLLEPARAIGVAALRTAGPLASQPIAVVGPSDDRLGPGGGLAGVAFAVQLDHHVGAQSGVLLVAADPRLQLSRRPFPDGKGARVERHKHWIQGRWCGPAAALAGRLYGALPDRLGVAGRHAQAVPLEGFA